MFIFYLHRYYIISHLLYFKNLKPFLTEWNFSIKSSGKHIQFPYYKWAVFQCHIEILISFTFYVNIFTTLLWVKKKDSLLLNLLRDCAFHDYSFSFVLFGWFSPQKWLPMLLLLPHLFSFIFFFYFFWLFISKSLYSLSV